MNLHNNEAGRKVGSARPVVRFIVLVSLIATCAAPPGHPPQHAGWVQVSWRVWILRAENLLEGDASIQAGWHCAEGTLWRRHRGTCNALKNPPGASGSVSRALPPSQVRLTRIGSRTALLPRDPQVKPPAARDLLYLAPSPDFCHLDPENGIPGTAGRRCNGKVDRRNHLKRRRNRLRGIRHQMLCCETGTSRLAPDGCELVCCGPGYRAGRAEVVQRCSCKFSWCCSVRCQQCKNTVTIHTCKVWETRDEPHPQTKTPNRPSDTCEGDVLLQKMTFRAGIISFSTHVAKMDHAQRISKHGPSAHVNTVNSHGPTGCRSNQNEQRNSAALLLFSLPTTTLMFSRSVNITVFIPFPFIMVYLFMCFCSTPALLDVFNSQNNTYINHCPLLLFALKWKHWCSHTSAGAF